MSEMENNDLRTPFFKRDESLEGVLKELNNSIEAIEPPGMDVSDNGPIILIMGCPRAGSTAVLQWLASSKLFSYPSNLIARFYKNPYFGIRIQQALLEYDPLNQIGFDLSDQGIRSELGKTMGALQPSEYWYFWREYFKFEPDSAVLSEPALAAVDGASFVRKLQMFETFTAKPLVLKGMLLNYHIEQLHKYYPKFLFINLVRDPFYNAQSLVFAREKYFDDSAKWYSFKPPQYDELKGLEPLAQVAGQVVHMQQAVKQQLDKLPGECVLTTSYTDVCQNPQGFLNELSKKYNQLGGRLLDKQLTFENRELRNSNKVRLSKDETTLLKEHIVNFESLYKL